MNTLPSNHKLKLWMSLAIGLIVLAGAILVLACSVLILTPRVIDGVALRPLADQLGTEPSKAALVTYVNGILEDHKGSSREDVHQLLDDIGGFSFLRPFTSRNGESGEEAWWTLAELPLGVEIAESWTLRYDTEDRLTEVELNES